MRIKNKYLVLIGVLFAQVTIAGLYAYSIIGTAITSEKGWSENSVLLAYSIAQFVFALSTILSGRLVDRKGPRITIIIGGLLYGGGLILSSLATSPFMLYITYGVLVGSGVGFVYVCPLSTLIKWFPNNKGMITGLSVAVFGGGSIIFKEILSKMLENSTVDQTFLNLSLISLALIIIGGIFASNPEGYTPKELTKSDGDYETGEMIKTSDFKKIWLMFWFAVIPGLLLLGASKNIGIEVAGLNASTAANLVSILAIANATSRLISGTVSDKVGVLNVIKASFAITVLALISLVLFASNPFFFYIGVVGIAVGYGGFLSLFPTLTNKKFGSFRYASNYGIVYQAYGLAALSGIFIKSMAGSYTNTFIISAIASTIGLIIAFSLKENK